MIDLLGPAINSAKSMFLYGDSGNGKTAIAETIAHMLGGSIFVPYAVEVDGQIMVLYDPVYHHEVRDEAAPDRPAEATDRCGSAAAAATTTGGTSHVHRPVVLTGGELTLDQLDLQYDPHTKLYQAPFQLKANGGVLIVDDFGRQRVPPRDLLNRWIVPLEKRMDFLDAAHRRQVPGAVRLPADLRDQHGALASWSRRHFSGESTTRSAVESPRRAATRRSSSGAARRRGMPYEPARRRASVQGLLHGVRDSARAACHPRDILAHLCDIAKFGDRADPAPGAGGPGLPHLLPDYPSPD